MPSQRPFRLTARSSQSPRDVQELLTVACNSGGAIGDGVDANDKPFTTTFPYLASPHSGNP